MNFFLGQQANIICSNHFSSIFLGCSNFGGQWYFMADFGNHAKVFTEHIAKEKLPLMVLRFLEANVKFENADAANSDLLLSLIKPKTRNVCQQIDALQLLVPTVKIARDLDLEVFLLKTSVPLAVFPDIFVTCFGASYFFNDRM